MPPMSNFYARICVKATPSSNNEHFEAMAEHVLKHWFPLETAFTPLDKAAVIAILKASL